LELKKEKLDTERKFEDQLQKNNRKELSVGDKEEVEEENNEQQKHKSAKECNSNGNLFS
jgi:hypothetical protein